MDGLNADLSRPGKSVGIGFIRNNRNDLSIKITRIASIKNRLQI
jgi:hypothetical protein